MDLFSPCAYLFLSASLRSLSLSFSQFAALDHLSAALGRLLLDFLYADLLPFPSSSLLNASLLPLPTVHSSSPPSIPFSSSPQNPRMETVSGVNKNEVSCPFCLCAQSMISGTDLAYGDTDREGEGIMCCREFSSCRCVRCLVLTWAMLRTSTSRRC